jgi:hypothetical protein
MQVFNVNDAKACSLTNGNHFHPRILFVRKVKACFYTTKFEGFGEIPAAPSNIRLGLRTRFRYCSGKWLTKRPIYIMQKAFATQLVCKLQGHRGLQVGHGFTLKQ